MINIITSNGIEIKAIDRVCTDFIISHLTLVYRYAFASPKPVYRFKVYYEANMVLDDEEYKSDVNFEYELIPVSNIPEALNLIAHDIMVSDKTIAESDHTSDDEEDEEDSDQEEVMVAVACYNSWNKHVIKYLDKQFRSNKSTTECLDLYQYLSVARTDRLAELLRATLNTEFVYAEDPISLGFAINRVFGGVL